MKVIRLLRSNNAFLLGALAISILFVAAGTSFAAAASAKSVRVKLTYVEMNKRDVKSLSVLAAPLNKRRNDLAAVENAARRAHVKISVKNGPTIDAKVGAKIEKDDVEVVPLSIRNGRSHVQIREIVRTTSGRRRVTHVVAASYTYRSGETRRLAGTTIGRTKYRYVFATVTELP